MPRSPRLSLGGYCYHVLNRGNGRRTVFRKPGDYGAFLKAARHACEKAPMRILAGCLMPKHRALAAARRRPPPLDAVADGSTE